MSKGPIGPIVSIRDATRAERLVWFFCRWCGHASRCDPREIARRSGREVQHWELTRRLKCGRCHRKGFAVVIVSEHRFGDRH